MADPYQPVQQNGQIQVTARTWNGLLKAGQDYSRRKYGTATGGVLDSKLTPSCRIWVFNSGPELPEFSVVGFGNMPAPPTSRPLDAIDEPLFLATTPTAVGPFAILAGSLAPGEIGEGIIAGAAVVQINVSDPTHGFALPADGNSAALTSDSAGGVPILWKDTGTGLKWAVVLLGGGGAVQSITFSVVTDASFDSDACTLSVTKTTLQVTGSNLSVKTL